MKDAIMSLIIKEESKNVDYIMRNLANKIQGDFVGLTYKLLDQYYDNYDPKRYIRTDILKGNFSASGKKRGSGGKFKKQSKQDKLRKNDISLRSAITAMNADGTPAIGLARGNYQDGYVAGVVFDESYFDANMKHSVHGDSFDEMDIVSNFLFSGDGDYGYGNIASRSPSAATELDMYLNNYDSNIRKYYDKFYKNVIKSGV